MRFNRPALRSYKLRAECPSDVLRFIEAHAKAETMPSVRLDIINGLDTDMAFQSHMTLTEIRALLEKIPNGHVMLESIDTAHRYTGERYHTR